MEQIRVLLIEDNPPGREVRDAAGLMETISRVVHISIDTEPLYREAEKIEIRIKRLREQTKAATRPSGYQNMYI